MSILQSSNPVLSEQSLDRIFAGEGRAAGGARAATASIQGVMAKTGVLTVLAVAAGAFGYQFVKANPGFMTITWIATLVVSLVAFFVLMASPKLAVVVAPIYSITQGVFLGALSMVLDLSLIHI